MAALTEAAQVQQPVQERPQRLPIERVADDVVAVFATTMGKGCGEA